MLIVSVISLLCLIIISFVKNDVVNRKKLIKKGNKIILNTKEKLVLFGGDLSWVDDYIDSIKKMNSESKDIEVYFPESKYKNSKDNEEFLNRIIELRKAGAKVYSLNNDYGLRCIIIDPDTYNSNDNMEIMITDRILRHAKDNNKNKYNFRYLKYSDNTQKNICKSYITNYNYVKNNIISEY